MIRRARRFRSRHCRRLAYQSQREAAHDLLLTRVQNMRGKLGGSPTTCDPFPPKPKGTHWRTYERLSARALAMELRMWGAVAVR